MHVNIRKHFLKNSLLFFVAIIETKVTQVENIEFLGLSLKIDRPIYALFSHYFLKTNVLFLIPA